MLCLHAEIVDGLRRWGRRAAGLRLQGSPLLDQAAVFLAGQRLGQGGAAIS
jgi:hypothetical protein